MKKRKDGRFRTSYTKDGDTKYFYGETEKEVKKQKKEYILAANTSAIQELEEKYFNDVADEWLANIYVQVKPITYKSYQEKVNKLKKYFKGKCINRITLMNLQNYINDLYKNNFSKSSLRQYKNRLSQIFDFAIHSGYSTNNLCTQIKIPKHANEDTRRPYQIRKFR